jgi:hypothetical protein
MEHGNPLDWIATPLLILRPKPIAQILAALAQMPRLIRNFFSIEILCPVERGNTCWIVINPELLCRFCRVPDAFDESFDTRSVALDGDGFRLWDRLPTNLGR